MDIDNDYKNSILNYLKVYYADILNFWIGKNEQNTGQGIQDHCDIIYILHLIDLFDIINYKSIKIFSTQINQLNLPIFNQNKSADNLSIHNTAYLLGALNILRLRGYDIYPEIINGKKKIEIQHLLNTSTKQPVYPTILSHHIWRVSHWIGGIPSIIYSLMMTGILYSEELKQILNQTISACDSLISSKTGLLKTYRNDNIHWFFRKVYSIRHNPDLGDIGGIVHLHWINYLLSRPYKSMEILYEKSIKYFLERHPFMENMPYCLDFDIVQIIRTCVDQGVQLSDNVTTRTLQMMKDIESFFIERLNSEYKIHKLPGALATYHECALLLNLNHLTAFKCIPKDIIKEAYWI